MEENQMFNMERYQRLKLYDYQNNQRSNYESPYGHTHNSAISSGISSEMPYLNNDLSWMVKRFKNGAALNSVGIERAL